MRAGISLRAICLPVFLMPCQKQVKLIYNSYLRCMKKNSETFICLKKSLKVLFCKWVCCNLQTPFVRAGHNWKKLVPEPVCGVNTQKRGVLYWQWPAENTPLISVPETLPIMLN
ncbi:MAG: hypothetical protein NXI17_03280 [Alphaproteobacteria bacterium]|nr:hypothetical protein [Alphaproteobacteria bacterium]